ncbi:MAG: hypothetical protein CFE21_14190 [Bacteroidetes bacterium B1(2017)]|nr:MAG: hypothetical protein CFE21_14190 [Bacteroidetes bacterium B1(2017)]
MNIEITKFELINRLMCTTDEAILDQLMSVFNKAGNTPETISIAQYNKELDAAEARIKSGKFINHDDLELESEGW